MQSSTLFAEVERGAKAVAPLSWVDVNRHSPYFQTEDGRPWTPIGQNDGITWPELRGLYRRRDMASAEAYLKLLADHGVTCLRLMLEYSQGTQHHFERPVGRPRPEMVQLWDDLFHLCERNGLRILLTPYDTFWLWIKWARHPYNQANGGPCKDRAALLLCRNTREAIKARLAFATERWGASGALFAWDVWNEIHPAYAQDSAECFMDFVNDLSTFLRQKELQLHGRAHPQTVSVFGPHMVLDKHIPEIVFRHSSLDFASTHFYEEGTIDCPQNTVDAAVSTARLMRDALAELRDNRPFLDTEHGPIHTYKDHHTTLPEPFDDEYFRHMQWAHFCSGGSGGGMRWPNRSPHSLTLGMRKAQRSLAEFLPLIDWEAFNRANWNEEVRVSDPAVRVAACGDRDQALVWLLRSDTIGPRGMLRRNAQPLSVTVELPCLRTGRYRVTAWDTLEGIPLTHAVESSSGAGLEVEVSTLVTDLALAIRSEP